MKPNFKFLAILFLSSISAFTQAQTYVADKTIPLPGDGTMTII